MSNPYGVPELTPAQLAEKQEQGEPFVLLDVREPYELQMANLGVAVTQLPMSRLVREGEAALLEAVPDREQEIVIFCHHGHRSAQVGAWLRQNGWTNVSHLGGGIDAYARDVDPAVGSY